MLYFHGALGHKNERKGIFDNAESIDLPGHGDSSEKLEDMTIASLSNWLSKMGQNRGKVFRYSMGGYIALFMQAKGLAQFESITTYATKLSWDETTYKRQSRFLDPASLEMSQPKFSQHLHAIHGEKWKSLVQQTLGLMLDLAQGGGLTPEDIKEIDIPIRLLHGSKDRMVTQEETQNIAFLNSSIEMKSIEEFPHEIQRCDPATLREYCL